MEARIPPAPPTGLRDRLADMRLSLMMRVAGRVRSVLARLASDADREMVLARAGVDVDGLRDSRLSLPRRTD